MKRSNVNKTMAALAVVGVLLTACSGSDDDAEGRLVDEPAEQPAEEPADDGLFGDDGRSPRSDDDAE
ncbi:MAG TPA: hypothetical protein VK917_01665, partial [Ilumatobacter sp.]|nr:hypothetical protein [Ilumatobacter sp.]